MQPLEQEPGESGCDKYGKEGPKRHRRHEEHSIGAGEIEHFHDQRHGDGECQNANALRDADGAKIAAHLGRQAQNVAQMSWRGGKKRGGAVIVKNAPKNEGCHEQQQHHGDEDHDEAERPGAGGHEYFGRDGGSHRHPDDHETGVSHEMGNTQIKPGNARHGNGHGGTDQKWGRKSQKRRKESARTADQQGEGKSKPFARFHQHQS